MPALMVLGVSLARINLKAGRGDRDGAIRVATFIFSTSLLGWVLGTSHSSGLAPRSDESSPPSAAGC